MGTSSKHTAGLPTHEQLRGRPPVFILGAGFSRDYNPSLLPLTADFLQIAEANKHLFPESKHGLLVEFVNRYFHDYKTANIEAVATFLTSSLLPDEIDRFENRPQLYSDLLDVVVDTVDQVHQHPVTHDVYLVYQLFAQLLVNIRATAVTFNYDLILDTLLRRTDSWSCLDGYGCEMRVINNPTEKIANEKARIPRSKAQYLKLHGSVNWGKLSIPPPYEPASVYLNQWSLPIDGPDGGLMPIMAVSHSHDSIRAGTHPNILMQPFIVPPLLTKEEFRGEPILSNVWFMAKDAIWKSRTLFIIGYSFPPTDFLFESLLRQTLGSTLRAFSDNPSDVRQIYLVQPKFTEGYIERVQAIFGKSRYIVCETTTIDFLAALMQEYKEIIERDGANGALASDEGAK